MLELKVRALETALLTEFHEQIDLLLEHAEEIYQWLIDEDF